MMKASSSSAFPGLGSATGPSGPVVRRFALAVALAVGAIAFLLGASGWLSYTKTERELAAEAETVVTLVSREAEHLVSSLDLLLGELQQIAGTTDWSDPDAGSALQPELERLRRLEPGAFRLFIFDRTGAIRATNADPVDPTVNASRRDYFRAHVEREAGLFIGRPLLALIDQTPIFVLSRRLSDADGNFAGAVSVSVRPEVIAAFYRSLAFAPKAVFTWARADGQRLVSEPMAGTDPLPRTPMPPAFAERIARAPEAGRYEFVPPSDGTERHAFYRRVGEHPLYVVVDIQPGKILEAWLDRILPYMVLVATALLALGGAAAYALRWARAEDVYRNRLADALRQKDLLLREVDHRVKNSLQLVCSLLYIQKSKATDPEQQQNLTEAIGRVSAIARVHERLYRSGDVRSVETVGYLRALGAELELSASAGSEPWEVAVAGEPIDLPHDGAVKLGLVLNELVTNAFKYGRPDGPRGRRRVEVELSRRPGRFLRLTVRDHGPGLPPRAAMAEGLGMRLVRSLAGELGGRLRIENAAPGARFVVELPDLAVGRHSEDRSEPNAHPVEGRVAAEPACVSDPVS